MTESEIIALMELPISAVRIPQYRIIYQLFLNKPFTGCLCGNGASILYNTCKTYANNLKIKNNII